MGFFSAPQLALASGKSVIYDELYKLEFLSGSTGFYWTGFGSITVDGDTYLGAANLVERSEIPFGIDDEAGDLTLTLSGVDPALIAKVRAADGEIYGQPISVWGQLFDEALQPSGGKWLIFKGVMDVPTYSAPSFGTRAIIIPCEGEWTDRNSARFSMFSDRDQKARFPGDRGLEYVYRITQGVRLKWPQF